MSVSPFAKLPLASSWEGRAFEIDFADYIEIEPGQWAPLSIRIESKVFRHG